MKNLKGKKILVVDDSKINRLVANIILNEQEILVSEATDGEEAIQHLESNPCDLVLMDLKMPVLDGFEATKIIRNRLQLSIPIIALTANFIEKEKVTCLEIGMNCYLSKPYDKEMLIANIRHFIAEE